ncbi:MAG: SRPBCC family protein [Acidimicrobiales bacterium]
MSTDRPGWDIVRFGWAATGLLCISLVLGLVAPSWFGWLVVAVSVAMFAGGVVTFAWSYLIAVERSRTDELSVAGLYLLAEGAPKDVRINMLGALGVQVVASLAAAAVKPYSFMAFGILAPLLGMGLAGMWSARHGQFRPRMADQVVMGNTPRRWQNQDRPVDQDHPVEGEPAVLDEATETRVINASPARCYEIATDFASYPEWTTDLKDAEVVDADAEGRAELVAFRAAAMGRSATYTLRYDHSDAPRVLSWTQDSGDITKRLEGSYLFEPVDGEADKCQVTYHLIVELAVPLPGFVKRRAEGRIIHTALDDLQSRAETV